MTAETEPPAFSMAALAAAGLFAASQGTDCILHIDSWISLMFGSRETPDLTAQLWSPHPREPLPMGAKLGLLSAPGQLIPQPPQEPPLPAASSQGKAFSSELRR